VQLLLLLLLLPALLRLCCLGSLHVLQLLRRLDLCHRGHGRLRRLWLHSTSCWGYTISTTTITTTVCCPEGGCTGFAE